MSRCSARYLVITGDSFCAVGLGGWPSHLARHLGLKLKCAGFGGGAWWPSRNWLTKLPESVIQQTEVMILVHTNAERIPTLDLDLVRKDYANLDPNDVRDQALELYFRWIHNEEFLRWAQLRWFEEIGQRWNPPRMLHLHSFPWTEQYELSGTSVLPNLSAISLNEVDAQEFRLDVDHRDNHLNKKNNLELARQLADIIQQPAQRQSHLNPQNFEHKTLRWLSWR